jgi:hypothetical protein
MRVYVVLKPGGVAGVFRTESGALTCAGKIGSAATIELWELGGELLATVPC